jgi:hypothetical protein
MPAPSHCSLDWLTIPSPHTPGHWQFGVHAPGQAAASVPSHCSEGWFT